MDKYSKDNVEILLKHTAHQYGYYYTAWSETGSREDRESKAYMEGRGDLLADIYNNASFGDYLDTETGKISYDEGEKRYREERDEE